MTNATNPDCPPYPNPGPVPCDTYGNMTNATNPDCPPYPNPGPVPCDTYGNMTNATNPDCPPYPNPGPVPCDTYGNMTNATNPDCTPPCEYGNNSGNATCLPAPPEPSCYNDIGNMTGGNMTGGNMTGCPPHADAGLDRTVTKGKVITIDGSRSYDIDGKIIHYLWTYRIGNGPEVILLDKPHTVKLTLKAPMVSRDRIYFIKLTVTDDDGLIDSDSMKLLVKNTVSGIDVTQKTTTKTVTTTKREGLSNYYYIGRIGFPGSGKGQVLEPTDTAIDNIRNLIYVADKNNNRIDVFDTSGKYIKSGAVWAQGRDNLIIPPIWPEISHAA